MARTHPLKFLRRWMFISIAVPHIAAAQVPIPQAVSSGGVSAGADAGNYISWLYTFGLGLVGLSALIVLVAGGVWYMSAGDNEGRVKQARTWMGNAVYGLVLALVSWLILFTINPDLVRKLNLELTAIQKAPPIEIAKIGEDQYGCTNNAECTEGYQCIGFAQGKTPGRCISEAIESQPSTYQCGFTKETDCIKNADFCVWSVIQGRSARCASRATPLVAAPASVPLKSGICGQTACKLDPNLGNKLSGLAQKSGDIKWQVTEAWPPTVEHQAQCHTYGMCVDANFTQTPKTPKNIQTFIEKAKESGLLAVYEVKTPERQKELLGAGLTANQVIVVERITGEHFSVYNLLSQQSSQPSAIQLPQQNQ